MTAQKRIALIGFGLAGATFHAPLIAATDSLSLAAVVTRDPIRRQALARDHPAARPLDSADAIWSAPGDYELVVVASPNRLHAEHAEAAVRAGIPVVVDKPLAAGLAQANGVIAFAQAHGVPLTVFQNRRWDGDFLTVRRLIADGALGTVHRFESRFERWRPEIALGWRESADPADAGGVLFDLGAHLIDQALLLFGPAVSVVVQRAKRRAGATVDDDAFVAIEHADGVSSHLWMSLVAAQPGPRFRALGSVSAFVKWGTDPQEAALRGGAAPGSPGWGEDDPANYGTLGAGDEIVRVPTEAGAYQQFYAEVARALDGAAAWPVDPRDAAAALAVIEAGA